MGGRECSTLETLLYNMYLFSSSAFTTSSTSSSSSNSFGNINRIPTSGASWKTAQQDKLDYKGAKASQTLAETDSDRMKKYRDKIIRVANETGIQPCLIAAIISRESRAGKALKNGWGDWSPKRQAWNAWGLMQVDVNPEGGGHTPRGAWDSEEHILQGKEILISFIGKIRKKFPKWSKEHQLKGAIAAYNQGDGKVHSFENVDENTTGKDYSNDVISRALWYQRNGYKN
ncbi:lysozyme g isoform X1 [Cynoglossus semilaevis]|uniref:lysozyme g isoform X1 n=1 Tax=Cynoglossus semilaevis TaxID=244447 RepID=UPI000D62E6CC|nr:lysozyme g isoform X1 [Cynoglossus semilaevis]